MKYLEALKSALLDALSQGTWEDIEADHKKAQLAWREDLDPGWGKPKYVKRVLAEIPNEELIALGQRCIRVFPERSAIDVQDALWWLEAGGVAAVSEITRLGIADALDERVMHPRENPDDFLQHFANVTNSGFGRPPVFYGHDGSLYCKSISDVDLIFGGTGQDKNPEPYAHRDLLDFYGFRPWPDKRVFEFLEALVHPTTRQGAEQDEWVNFINGTIVADGFFLEEIDRLSGHPLFSVRRRDRGVGGKPKNLIFASTGPKPELGFRDAVNNDLVILKHAEHCLIYEDRISDNGLLWDELVIWWAKTATEDPQGPDVRRTLGQRLLKSLGSEVEKHLFAAYFRRFQPVLGNRLPALVPQVYLHYDPATLSQLWTRGEDRRFLTQRMDFLLLLPERVRVVLEVDGKQHYSDGEGASARPSPSKYAETTKADRFLRLAGYEVYRELWSNVVF